MSDPMSAGDAQRIAHRRTEHVRASLTRDAQHLADDTALYAKTLADGAPEVGMANRIAQSALQLAQLAATLSGMVEAGAYLDAVADGAEVQAP